MLVVKLTRWNSNYYDILDIATREFLRLLYVFLNALNIFSGVFIDILVAVMFFAVVAGIGFAIMPNWNVPYAAFVAASAVFLVCFLVAIGLPLLTRRRVSIRRANSWWPRHFFG